MPTDPTDVRHIDSRRELFADDWLIARHDGTERRLHHPTPTDVALTFDQPWEGPDCCYVTVFQDTDRYRMYYSCYPMREFTGPNQFVGYAESDNGLDWHKPNLRLISFNGSRENNLILGGTDGHTFAPFIDTRPDVGEAQRYKAVAGNPPFTLVSADGIHWRHNTDRPMVSSDDPALDEVGIGYWEDDPAQGRAICDSHNLAFWDDHEGCYVYYFRGWCNDVRSIYRLRSDDFATWSNPEPLTFSTPPTPLTQFYTNGVHRYFRAPHLYIALPMRYAAREALSPASDRFGIAEAEFMFSRDGVNFERYMEPFVRPGIDPLDWTKHNNMPAWGMLNLSPGEISLYYTRHHFAPTACLQRAVLRADGFVSLHAPFTGGECLTQPVVFAGDRLELNVATGVSGSVRVEIQDADGKPVSGFGLEDSREFYGDQLDYIATWRDNADVGALAGRPVRLRFAMRDADVFSMWFHDERETT